MLSAKSPMHQSPHRTPLSAPMLFESTSLHFNFSFDLGLASSYCHRPEYPICIGIGSGFLFIQGAAAASRMSQCPYTIYILQPAFVSLTTCIRITYLCVYYLYPHSQLAAWGFPLLKLIFHWRFGGLSFSFSFSYSSSSPWAEFKLFMCSFTTLLLEFAAIYRYIYRERYIYRPHWLKQTFAL